MIPLYDTIHSRSFPFVNWMLIIANVAFFLIEIALGSDVEQVEYIPLPRSREPERRQVRGSPW